MYIRVSIANWWHGWRVFYTWENESVMCMYSKQCAYMYFNAFGSLTIITVHPSLKRTVYLILSFVLFLILISLCLADWRHGWCVFCMCENEGDARIKPQTQHYTHTLSPILSQFEKIQSVCQLSAIVWMIMEFGPQRWQWSAGFKEDTQFFNRICRNRQIPLGKMEHYRALYTWYQVSNLMVHLRCSDGQERHVWKKKTYTHTQVQWWPGWDPRFAQNRFKAFSTQFCTLHLWRSKHDS